MTFVFLAADTASPANGPNGRDCQGGAAQWEDLVEFDGNYTCNCPTNTTGDNCDILAGASSAADTAASDTAVSLSVLGALAAIFLLILGVMRCVSKRNTTSVY